MPLILYEGLTYAVRRHALVTASIVYHLPDHPNILQEYIWQDFDLLPELPGVKKFLNFWRREIEGPLHSVRIAHVRLIDIAMSRGIVAPSSGRLQ